MSLITRDDAGMITCVTATRMERHVMDHRGVRFELDTIGLDTWRWTILTDRPHGFRLIGQYRGKRDAAVDHCVTTIDAHLENGGGARA